MRRRRRRRRARSFPYLRSARSARSVLLSVFDHSKNFTRSFRLLDFLSSSLHYQTLFNLQQSNPLPSSTIFDTRKKDTSTLEKGRTIHESMSRRINILAKLFGCIELPCLVLQNHEDMIREQQQQQRGYELSSHRKLHRPE